MKAFPLTIITSCFTFLLSAQVPMLNIFPDPTTHAQQPYVAINYYISPWSPGCYELDTVVRGQVVTQEVYGNSLKITIIWEGTIDGLPGSIEVVRADSSCADLAPGRAWEVPLIPFSPVVPTVSGPRAFYIGEYTYISLTAKLDTTGLGPNGIAAYQWEGSSDWSLNSYGQYMSILITPEDTLAEGCVRVRARYTGIGWGSWVNYCLQGTIRSPCPINLVKSYLPCGDTVMQYMYTTDIVLPHVSSYHWTPTEYSWSVPPGWTILSTNPDIKSKAAFQPDGHTNGLISVFATAGDFTSAVCEYQANFLTTDPATTIIGPDFVCQTGEFRLSHQPFSETTVTWQVSPVNSAAPQAVFPDHGSGNASFQVNDEAASGYFRIVYTITNQCGTDTYAKDFFIGKPSFFNTTLDGKPYINGAQPLCAGGHGATTEVIGADNRKIIWSASSGVTGYTQRDSFVFLLAPTEAGNCPVVSVSATNICGTSTLPMEVCPQEDCDAPTFDLLLYPNPAHLIVFLKVSSDDPITQNYTLIEKVEIFNNLGQLVTIWDDAPSKRIIKAIVDLPHGVYTLRATVQGQIFLKRLLIAKAF